MHAAASFPGIGLRYLVKMMWKLVNETAKSYGTSGITFRLEVLLVWGTG